MHRVSPIRTTNAWTLLAPGLLLLLLAPAILSAQAEEFLPELEQRVSHEQANRTRKNRSRKITKPSGEAASFPEKGVKKTQKTKAFWTTLGSLSLVILLILLTGKFWKTHGPSIHAGLPVEAIEVLGKKLIDSRQTIYLIRLGSRILILGSSATGLQTLAEITDPVDVDYLAGLCQQPDGDQGIAQTFRSLFNRQSTTTQQATSSFLGDGSLSEPVHPNPMLRPEEGSLEEVHG